MVTLQLRQLSVPPGHRVMLHDISWREFEAILEELGVDALSGLPMASPSDSIGLQSGNLGDKNAIT